MSNKEITVEELRDTYEVENQAMDNYYEKKSVKLQISQNKIKEMNDEYWEIEFYCHKSYEKSAVLTNNYLYYDSEKYGLYFKTFNEAIDWAYQKYLEMKDDKGV
jgi:hypothetical protein